MKWKKLGRIFVPNGRTQWMATHAMIPIAEHLSGDRFRIYFTARNTENKGHVGSLEIDLRSPQQILRLSRNPLLSPGDLGCFDDSGAVASCLVGIGKAKILYYTGINLGVTVKIRNSIGMARWNKKKNRFERCYLGPIVDRTPEAPHFVATPDVMWDQGRFKMWFTSCVRWENGNGRSAKHFYRLEYADSKDGVAWNRNGIVAVDFRDRFEYALGVPRVIREDGIYKMWFCSRATKTVETYRIRYAESKDGIKWKRMDELAGIDVSRSGWDSEMICYPFVFDHKGNRYMLYNGNGYGRSGFGLAVLTNQPHKLRTI